MIEVKKGLETIDLPYTVRLYGVTETMFDELADEDTKAELIDGVMIVHSPASIEHDDISGFLRALMSFYADAKGLGKVLGPDSLVRLAASRKCAPDVFFVRQAQVPTPLPKEFAGAPDLVVEVLSPSNRDDDLLDKRPIYQTARVGEMWFVDPEYQRVLVDHRQGDGYTAETITTGPVVSTVMPGFWIQATWLWAKPLPNRFTCLQDILHET
jgi:Uma2 family endonuclease